MASLGDLTATLRANTAQFTGPMQDAVAQMRALGIEAGKATGAERAFLVAQQQAISAGLKKEGLVIINGQLVASETALAEATERTSAAMGGGAVGVGRIERSIASLISRSVGLPTQFGSISASLARMSAGIVGSLGIIAAIGLLTIAFSALIDKMREGAKQAEETRKRLQGVVDVATLKQEYDDANQAATDLAAAQSKLDDAIAHKRRTVGPSIAAQPFTSDFFNRPAGQVSQADLADPLIHAANQAVIDAQARYDAAQKLLAQARAQRNKNLGGDNTVVPPPAPEEPKAPSINTQGFKRYYELRADAERQANDDAFQALQDSFRQQDAFFQQQGQTLAKSLSSGFVNGNLATSLLNGLKSIFVSVLEKLLEDGVIKGLVKRLEEMFNITAPSAPSGGLGGIIGAVIGAVGSFASGGLGALAFSPSVAAGGASTLARGAGATVVVPLSGMPRALGPVEHARDGQWQAVFSETVRVARQQGIKLGTS